MPPVVRKWYLVFCKPRQEAAARVNLERQGYDVYLPMVAQRRRRGGKCVEFIEPLFPRYLFIHLDAGTDDWRPIRSTIGVSALVQFGQQPARVPDDLIAALRAHESGQGVHEIPVEPLREGDRIRIVEGALSGFEGLFLARSGRDRVVVLLEIMGKPSRISLDPDTLEPLEK